MSAKANQIGGVTITYNRKGNPEERGYIVTNGTGEAIYHTPSGAAGKEAAIIKAVEIEDTDLYEKAKYMTLKNPLLAKRIWAACQLILNGHVLPPIEGNLINEVAQVISEGDESITYTIQFRDGCICNCDDYQFQKAPQIKTGQRFCKHILSYLISKHLGRMENKEVVHAY